MKRKAILLFTLLLGLSYYASANRFYVSAQRVFTAKEDVKISFSNYYYYRKNKEKDRKLSLRLFKVQDLNRIISHPAFQGYYNLFPDSLMKEFEEVKVWDHTFEHKQYSNVIDLGKLDEGLYILDAYENGELAQIPIFVSNYSMITKSATDELVCYMTDSETGAAIKGFKAVAMMPGKQKDLDGIYKNGVASFKWDGTANYAYPTVIATKDDKIAVSKAYFYNYYRYSGQNGLVSYLFTDRSAYRPEQTVKVKGILRQKTKFAFEIPADSISYQITDPQGNVVQTKNMALDGMGTFDDSLKLTKDMKLGTYVVRARVLGGRYAYWDWQNQYTFLVEEYKKPEYEVFVELDKPQYVLGDQMKVEVSAKYFFGSPVQQATVEYKVLREEYYVPYWRRWAYWWWYEDYYSSNYTTNPQVVKYGKGKLGEDGKFSVEFTTEESNKKNLRNYKYTVIADVRDASRRTISGSSTAMVAYTEYSITAYSEKYYYNMDEEASVVVSTANLSGEPVGTVLKAKVYRQFWEKSKWSKRDVQEQKVQTNPKTGEVEFRFTPTEAGYYHIDFEGEDKRGRKVTESCYLYVIQEGDWSYNWWHNNSGSIQIITDKKVYQSGEKVKAMIITRHEVDALVTAGGKNLAYYGVQGMKGKKLPEKGAEQGGMKQFEFEFDPDVSGKVEIAVNYVYQGKLYQRVERITMIPSHKYLEVSISFDRKDYKPRSWAEATIKVVDNKGRAVPNAQVILSTADESIYSLYPDKTKDIRKVFYANQDYSGYGTTYHNSFSNYKYSRQLIPEEVLARMKRYNQKFDRASFLKSKEWYQLFSGRNTKGGVIRGFVLDKYTGKPLANTEIKVKGKSFKTNKYGFYSLKGFGNNYIDLTFVGPKGKGVIKNLLTYNNRVTVLNVELGLGQSSHNFYPKLTKEQRESWSKAGSNTTADIDIVAEPDGSVVFLDKSESSIEEEDMMALGAAEEALEEVVVTSQSLAKAARKKTASKDLKAKASFLAKNDSGGGDDFKAAVVRKDFQDAIYWNPVVTTNSLGLAKVKIRLPDNLTTWRTTARVITQDTKVGQTLAKTIVRKNLLVRMETPRFMTVGDELLIATNIHNYLSEAKEVKVSLQADGVKVVGSEQIIQVDANGEKRIDWKVNASWATSAKLTVKALTNEESDAKEVKVPVKPFGLEMINASASYLQNDGKESFTVYIPKGTDLNTVNLELSAAPSITSALLSAMDDLIGYPYGCVEQTMSRFLPNVLVANTLKNLGGNYQSNISDEELAKMVAKGLERLGQLQQKDGGWGWWQNDGSSPYYTAYVSNGLYLAKKAGYEIDPSMYNNAMRALANQIRNRKTVEKGEKKSSTLHAYQMMVAMQCELKVWDKKSYKASDVNNSYEAALWLQAAHLAKDAGMKKEMQAYLEKNVQDEGGRNFWGGERYYYSWQKDQVETTANAVRALAMIDPNHKLLPGAAQWLLMKRKGKSWHNTRQTAMTIYGMNELIKKDFNPDMEVAIYVNGTKLDDLTFVRGSKGKNYQLKGTTFMASLDKKFISDEFNLLTHGDNTIRVVQKGKGTSYVNSKLSYFLDGKDDLKKIDREKEPFKVVRAYFKLERHFDKQGVLTYKKVPIAEGQVKSGDDILVKTKVISTVERDHVLIEDPIPAGCEFVRDTKTYQIEGEANYNGQSSYYGRWNYYYPWNRWYTHQEFRDSKFAMTITKLSKGEYSYSYIMKAQIPGKFNVTPAVSQLMYYPEVRGFSDFGTLEIKE